MSTYNEYSIQEIIPDLSQKRVTVKTNFKVDPNSINESTIALYNYDKAVLATYQYKIDGKDIHLILDDFPADGSRYYLKVIGIKDALGRTLKTSFDDYIIFNAELKTKVQIISPGSRETLKSRTVTIQLNMTDIEIDTKCRIEIATDNIFYNKLVTLEQSISSNELSVDTTIEREGQIYLRARAEKTESIVGDWSEVICFNIYSIHMDSIETTFLEDYLTTNDLLDEPSFGEFVEPEVAEKSPIAQNEGVFYLEFNKEIKLPEEYELDENGYINLGTIIGFRKGLK